MNSELTGRLQFNCIFGQIQTNTLTKRRKRGKDNWRQSRVSQGLGKKDSESGHITLSLPSFHLITIT